MICLIFTVNSEINSHFHPPGNKPSFFLFENLANLLTDLSTTVLLFRTLSHFAYCTSKLFKRLVFGRLNIFSNLTDLVDPRCWRITIVNYTFLEIELSLIPAFDSCCNSARLFYILCLTF